MAYENLKRLGFEEIWCVDFEFQCEKGERPKPLCLVAIELLSGRVLRKWAHELNESPYAVGPSSLFVSYFATAELGCHLALGWKLPSNVLDLYIEFRAMTNGKPTPGGDGLLGALSYAGIEHISSAEKDNMRNLVLRGGPYSEAEKHSILKYCESDVVSLKELFLKLLPIIDLPRALLRGRYMKAVANMEFTGIPMDAVTFHELSHDWDSIERKLIDDVGKQYPVYEGKTFKMDKWKMFLTMKGISWPQLPSGQLKMDRDTFGEMARIHPELTQLKEFRKTLGSLRLRDLAIGADGRNRCLLSPYRSKTGRNQPSNAKFVFGPAKWVRRLICPTRGMSLAYIDWEQQEFGIAAALSKDQRMAQAYHSGDPYLDFAKQVGAIPITATKESHRRERELYKSCCLAVQYGMGDQSLARRLREPLHVAQRLLKEHQRNFAKFWDWSDAAVDLFMSGGTLKTVFGWPLHPWGEVNVRSARNFPMQANGAEMLRIACILLTETGIKVCAPIHDAVLIEAKTDEIESVLKCAESLMREASSSVLSTMSLRTESKIISYPNSMQTEDDGGLWILIKEVLHSRSHCGPPTCPMLGLNLGQDGTPA